MKIAIIVVLSVLSSCNMSEAQVERKSFRFTLIPNGTSSKGSIDNNTLIYADIDISDLDSKHYEDIIDSYDDDYYDRVLINDSLGYFDSLLTVKSYFLLENMKGDYRLFNGVSISEDILESVVYIINDIEVDYKNLRRYYVSDEEKYRGVAFIEHYSINFFKVKFTDEKVRMLYVNGDSVYYSNWIEFSKLKPVKEEDYPEGF